MRTTLYALASSALLLSAGNAFATELTAGQMAAAGRVYLGDADCDLKEKVSLKAVDGKPGHFELSHRKAKYLLVPEETQTGAVRLEDRKAGIVWLQIPAKSMMLNTKIGQRMVDGCMHDEQRREAQAAGSAPGIGIAGTAAR